MLQTLIDKDIFQIKKSIRSMSHWTIICGIIVYCCSSITLISACWGLYIYWQIPWWIVVLVFLCSLCAVVLIPLCWMFFYWNFKSSNEGSNRVPIQLTISVEPPSDKSPPNLDSPVNFDIGKLEPKYQM